MHPVVYHKISLPLEGNPGGIDKSHTRQTIDRLQCIRKHLKNPQSFRRTAGELLDWCLDPRAFQTQFHQYLMSCLMEVNDVAGKPGYDLELCFRLLTVCNKRREMLPPSSSSMLNIWTHSVCKLMDLQRQHQQSKTINNYHKNAQSHPGNVTNEKFNYSQKMHCPRPSNDWSQDPQIGIQQPSLSVITTVWGMSKTQTPPVHSQSTAAAFAQPHIEVNMHSTFRQPNSDNTNMFGNNQRRVGPILGQDQTFGNDQQNPPSAAAAAAAMAAVAAAATATATATATFIKGQQEQDNMNSYNPMYGSKINDMHNTMHSMIVQQPYQYNNQQLNHFNHNMNETQTSNLSFQYQQQYAGNNYPSSQKKLSHYGPSCYEINMYENAHRSQPKQNFHGNKLGGVISNGFTLNSENCNQPSSNNLNNYKQPSMFVGRQFSSQYSNELQHPPHEYQNINRMTQEVGNPTPPLTPGTSNHELKNFNHGREELRLTFPVRDGIVLRPFRLQHNVPVTSHAFHLRQNVYEKLCERPDLDLQFKCYHHDDAMKHTNWPHSVQVNVNDNYLTIPRGTDRQSHKPLYFKNVSKPGRNNINIAVSACCCSHFFVLQMVHRPSMRFAIESLMFKSVVSSSQCIKLIQENFRNSAITDTNSSINPQNSEDFNKFSAVISLRCPITYQKIKIPARGQSCKHIQCFDLEAYLQLNTDNSTWRCPICHNSAILEHLNVDEFMQNILQSCRDQNRYLVSIDSNCQWELLPLSNSEYSTDSNLTSWKNDLHQNQFVQNNKIFVKQEKVLSNKTPTNSSHFVSSLSNKGNYKLPADVVIKKDPDAPPSKRLKDVSSPGFNLNNFPAPSPGSYATSLVYKKSDFSLHKEEFPHNYINEDRKPVSLPVTEMVFDSTENIARRDIVPIERKINHFSHPRLTSSLSNQAPVGNTVPNNNPPLARSNSCNANPLQTINFNPTHSDELGSDVLESLLGNDVITSNDAALTSFAHNLSNSENHEHALNTFNENPTNVFPNSNNNIPDDILSMFDARS